MSNYCSKCKKDKNISSICGKIVEGVLSLLHSKSIK